MTPGTDPDFGAIAVDYAAHRAGFPESFFERVAAFGAGPGGASGSQGASRLLGRSLEKMSAGTQAPHTAPARDLISSPGIGAPGQHLVDLGTGTGTLARGFARRGCRVIGIDPKEAMLEQARRLDAQARVAVEYPVEYRCATAEKTGLPDAAADIVTAGQCWHWFDRPAAAREAARILRPGGRILIAHFDWLPLRGNVVEATESLIREHNPSWLGGGSGLYPAWLADLGEVRFRDIETFSYDEPVVYTPEGWRGRIRASAGVGASLSPAAVAAFDAELGALLARRFPGPALDIPHRVFAVIATASARS